MKKLFFILVFISVLGIIYLLFFPDISRFKKENPQKTALMEYREMESKKKNKAYKITQTWVPLKSISPYLIKAVLIAEDDKFWSHEGFDFEAVQKAIEKDIKKKKFAFGGSTITQQLAKNLFLNPSKNPLRKIREAVITFRMERSLSKKRILELYLNVVEWGNGIFGIEAASRHYYGKNASELTPEEAARLAVILPSPRRYSLLSDSRYIEKRTGFILGVMRMRGIIPPEYEEPDSPQTDPLTN